MAPHAQDMWGAQHPSLPRVHQAQEGNALLLSHHVDHEARITVLRVWQGGSLWGMRFSVQPWQGETEAMGS